MDARSRRINQVEAESLIRKQGGKYMSEILNTEQACELLSISLKTFQKLLREESIPGRKIGREWRFSKQALIDWIGQGRSKDYKDEEGQE